MNKYAVKISDEAFSDIEKIYDYIANDLKSPDNAKSQYTKISEGILSLNSFPNRFPLFDAEPEHSWGMRFMRIGNYLVCFIVDSDTVTVTDVIYGASDVHFRLGERHP